MKKTILTIALAVILLAGCSAQQIQEQLILNQQTEAATVMMQATWDDPNLTQAEKLHKSGLILADYGEQTGLFPKESKQNFYAVADLALQTWLAWQPLPVGKLPSSAIIAIIAMAVAAFRKKK